MLTLLDRPQTSGLCLVRPVKWSPNGNHLAAILFQRVSGEPLSTILLWNLAESTSAIELGTFPARIMSLTFADHGRYLAAGIDHLTVCVWDLENPPSTILLPVRDPPPELSLTNENVRFPVTAAIPRVAACPVGGELVSYFLNRWSKWDLRTPGKEPDVGPEQNYFVDSCAMSIDGSVLAFIDTTGVVRRFTMNKGLRNPQKLASDGTGSERIIVSRCGQRFAFIRGNQLRIGSLDGKSRELITLKGHETFIYAAVFGPDRQTMLTGGHDGTTRFWNLDRQKELAQYDWGIGRVTAIDLSPDGTSVVVGGDGQQSLVMWDLD